MTQQQAQTTPRLKVVPPNEGKTPSSQAQKNEPQDQPKPPPENPSQPQENKSGFPYWRWVVVGGILVGLGAISLIPVPTAVRGEAQAKFTSEERDVQHMPETGIVSEVYVESDDVVEKGDPLAMIETQQLEEEISDWQIRIEERLTNIEAANQQTLVSRAEIERLQMRKSHLFQRIDDLEREVNNPQNLPQVQSKLQQIASYQEQLQEVQKLVERKAFKDAVKAGAISQDRKKEYQDQIHSLNARISEAREEIEAIKQRKQEELQRQQDRLNELLASERVAEQNLVKSQASVENQMPLVEKMRNEMAQRQQRQSEHQILKAEQDGTVVTSELYKLEGQLFQQGEMVLEIADPQRLFAKIRIRQEDSDLVHEGTKVTLKPYEPGLPTFDVTVSEIQEKMETDEQLGKSFLIAIANIEQHHPGLKPNAKLYAKIQTPHKIPLYERLRREFVNLFKVRSL
ncbi:HlyD family efflux transporter periplasmic adaptor subunit [Spirulina sp. CS-785/01]|uniref:HlyD family secretion protein n=1 Tax=Spirulina sp. CS-785/01 TaxID=3021716 RepID=UPI00232D6BB8|nr:HlyD family efflux transporter periplasmic adaptor subunit [Spirulina sp. CS-785/01]MDB9315091.1 HlyD family efflux transporter periplasmic adaptor subunit [Spirulina sp. CS-785/01]